MTVEPINDN